MVGLGRLELPTSRLSSARSNQLSYRPKFTAQSHDFINKYLEEIRRQQNYQSTILRKEVIQPQVPLRLPCYDLVPVADPTVDGCLLKG